MKIATFTDNFYPEISGISDSIIAFAREFSRRGHELVIYAPQYAARDYGRAGPETGEIKINERVKIRRLPSLPFPHSPTGQSRIVLPLLKAYFSLRQQRPDLIHSQSPFGSGWEALLAAKLLRLPLVGTNHTPIKEFMVYSGMNFPLAVRAMERYFVWYYNRTEFVTAPSGGILKEMVKAGLRRPRQAVSNPVDTRSFSPADAARKGGLKKELGLGPRAMLYTGRLAPEKHVDVIIRAAALVKRELGEINLVITGRGLARPGLEKLASELDLSRNVKFLGMVAESFLPRIYQAADVFAVMSTAETQCLSLMHAFASGLPAVAARARALPEYIRRETGFLVAPGDYKALAEKIIWLFRHPPERAKMGRQAREYVQQFRVEKIADIWEKIYQDIIRLQITN